MSKIVKRRCRNRSTHGRHGSSKDFDNGKFGVSDRTQRSPLYIHFQKEVCVYLVPGLAVAELLKPLWHASASGRLFQIIHGNS